MNRQRVRRSTVAGAAAILLGVTGYIWWPWWAAAPGTAGAGTVVLATGGTSGVYHQYGEALASAAGDQPDPIRLLTTTGSVENLNLVAQGQATFAFSTADAALDAFSGRAPFARAVPLRAVARLYDDYIHLVTLADSPVHAVGDLRGLRVSVGAVGSGTALIADRILRGALLDPGQDIMRTELSLTDAIAAIREQRIDAFFWSGGLPTSGLTELASATGVRLIDLAESAAALRAAYGSSYRTGSIPAGTYPGMAGAIITVAVPNLLVTTDATPAALVERTARLLFASAPRIAGSIPAVGQVDPHAAIFTGAIPLHDGARDYYRATKVPT